MVRASARDRAGGQGRAKVQAGGRARERVGLA